MVKPINDAIGTSYYVDGGSALTQKNFSDRLGKVVYDDRHPLITGLMTGVGNTFLSGWSRAGVEHIVTIYGFDFTSPTEGKIYYMETSTSSATVGS